MGIHFDSLTTDRVLTPYPNQMIAAAKFSFSCWLYIDSWVSNQWVTEWAGTTTGTTPHIIFTLAGTPNILRALIRIGGTNRQVNIADDVSSITTGEWFHYALVYDDTNIIAYHNGEAIHTVPCSGTLNMDGTGDIVIGNSKAWATNTNGMGGRMAEYGLTPTEIKKHDIGALASGASLARFGFDALYHPFYTGTASAQIDLSGRGLHGTATGTNLADHPPIEVTPRTSMRSRITPSVAAATAPHRLMTLGVGM